MPTLSIIIPTFNASSSIEKCLGSIIGQSFTDYEVIIQDGGSGDNTIKLIAHIQDANPGIQIHVHQENDNGIYDAMNKAVYRVRGDWLYFLGSDDELYDPEVLSTVMRSRDSALADVLYGNVKLIGNGGWAADGTVYDGPFELQKLLNKNISHQAIFYRAPLFRTVGSYNQSYMVWADWDFNLRCWSRTTFRYIDVIVANFQMGGVSTRFLDQRFIADAATNVQQYFNLSLDDPLLNTPAFIGYQQIMSVRQPIKVPLRRVSRVFKRWARKLILNS
jgi:glycosyltransferase involved in cell wall biosynthesis